jgi:hypothetical protein
MPPNPEDDLGAADGVTDPERDSAASDSVDATVGFEEKSPIYV